MNRLGLKTILVAGLLWLAAGPAALATNYAGLVVMHGDGSVAVRCVGFEGDSISAIGLLQESGLSTDLSNSALGTVVYGIDGEGSADDWNSGQYFWSYWHGSGGGWSYSQTGAGGYRVHPGDVEGWQWMSQNGSRSCGLPSMTFDDIYRSVYGDPQPTTVPTGADTAASANGQANGGGTTGNSATGNNNAANGAGVSTNGGAGTGSAKKQTGAKQNATGTAKKPDSGDGTANYAFFGFIVGGLATMAAYQGISKKRQEK
ncbi:MAG: hypothetical protein WC891_03990 [Actinomycetota bacterium]